MTVNRGCSAARPTQPPRLVAACGGVHPRRALLLPSPLLPMQAYAGGHRLNRQARTRLRAAGDRRTGSLLRPPRISLDLLRPGFGRLATLPPPMGRPFGADGTRPAVGG